MLAAAGSLAQRQVARVSYTALRASLCARAQHLQSGKASDRRQMSTHSHVHEVLVEAIGNARVATLNRPKALNSLNTHMCELLEGHYERWEADPKVQVVVMRGSGDKAFCAGGDVVSIAKAGMAGDTSKAVNFFNTEYKLDYFIGTLQKPHVAIVDGICMGGGVGLSVHSTFRVATETTLFAMPETAIGLFPDVGGSHFLPRLQGELGMYLALSGARLKGADVYHANIATHYIPRARIEELVQKLSTVQGGETEVKAVLDSFQAPAGDFSLAKHMDEINECFSKATVEDMLVALEKKGTDFARKARDTILTMSPTSCKVTARQIREGAKRDLGECLKMELRMACRFMEQKDFYEGIRAMLIDKTKDAKWTPDTFEAVTDDMVNYYFEMLPPNQELVLPRHHNQ